MIGTKSSVSKNGLTAIVLIGVLALASRPADATVNTSALSLSGASGAPGDTVTLNVGLSQSGGTSPVSIQWDLTYSASDLGLVAGIYYATGAAAGAAGKAALCNSISASDVRCIISGLNTTAIGNGTIATLTFKIAAGTTNTSTQVSLASAVASDGNADDLGITGGNATVTINPAVGATGTSTNVVATASDISAGGSTVLTATVTAASGTSSPTGTVSFKLGQTVLGAVALSGSGGAGSSSISVNGSQLAAGTNTITASYAGNASFSGSSASMPIVLAVATTNAVAPSSGSGTSQTFTLQYSDTAGASNLQLAWVYFTASLANPDTQSCLLYYNVGPNMINLMNDSGTAWLSATPGASTTLQNSQCSLNVAAITVTASGNTLTLKLPMTFQPAYGGSKNVYLYASDLFGGASGWQQLGTWTVAAAAGTPASVSVTPSSGTGTSQTFTLQYSDTAGASNLQLAWVYFTASLANPDTQSCLLYYNVGPNMINLMNDSGTAWLSATPGASTTLQNSQCSLNVAAITVTASGNTLTLKLPMTFQPAYGGVKNVYQYATDVSAASSGWQQRGTWTVPAAAGTPASVSITPSSGTGTSKTFKLQYSDTAGAANLQLTWVYFTASLSNPDSQSCLLYYNVGPNMINLLNDSGTAWLSATPGTSTTLGNSQCSLNVAAMTITPNGNTLTLKLPMTFQPAYGGAKNVYMFATDLSGATSGWQQLGAWSVQ